VIDVEPWRASAFPVIKDLVVDRSAFDRIIQAGGYISAPTGTAPDANAILVPKHDADEAFDAATCIGCGACVAACPNGSAMLFTAAKITHLGMLPQGQPERWSRVLGMVAQHDEEGFGGCTNIGECTAVCPKNIPLGRLPVNRDPLGAYRLASHWPKAVREELEEEEQPRKTVRTTDQGLIPPVAPRRADQRAAVGENGDRCLS
jgi:succinate dehydrogenase / fumarate reductase iron-sulfur subunit